MDDHAGEIVPYMDPVLSRDPQKYRRFIGDLHERALVHWTLNPKERVTIFFVRKKDGSLRMVIDARRPNRVFADPPGVSLTTAEALGRLENESGEELWMAELDVDNCFHRLKIDRDLGEYFCLPPLRAKDLNLSELDGLPLREGKLIWPCCAALPMGFSWSL